jgi:ribosomal protein S15P/S13E
MAESKSEKEKESKETPVDIEKTIVDLANQGLTSEKIGLVLKEKYSIKPKMQGIVIGKILKKHNLYQMPDIKNLASSIEQIRKHLDRNKHDHKTKRTVLIKEAKLKKLRQYVSKRA